MKIIVILLILLTNFQGVKFQTPVSIVVEKQEIIELTDEDDTVDQSSSIIKFPKIDVFPPDRRIIFKVANESNKPVIIFGDFYDTTFEPAGYIIEFDKQNQKWKYPGREDKSEEISYMIKQDKKVLNPKESFEFTALMDSEGNKDKIFKRTIYFSYKECSEPIELGSPEFSLK